MFVLGRFLTKFGVIYHLIYMIAMGSGIYPEYKNLIFSKLKSFRYEINQSYIHSGIFLFYFIFYVFINFKLHNDYFMNLKSNGNRKVQVSLYKFQNTLTTPPPPPPHQPFTTPFFFFPTPPPPPSTLINIPILSLSNFHQNK